MAEHDEDTPFDEIPPELRGMHVFISGGPSPLEQSVEVSRESHAAFYQRALASYAIVRGLNAQSTTDLNAFALYALTILALRHHQSINDELEALKTPSTTMWREVAGEVLRWIGGEKPRPCECENCMDG